MTRCVAAQFSMVVALTLLPAHLSGDSRPDIEKLAWMTGCWEGDSGKRVVEEHWTKPLGQSLLGMSRTVTGGKTVAYEFMRIHLDEANLMFTAQPSGQKEASFRLIRSSDTEIVFENPAHDFPQRVIYRRDSSGGLVGRIEGKLNGKDRAVDLPMKKAKCD